MRKRLGVPPHFYVKPLLYDLVRHEGPFDLQFDLSSQNSLKLKNKELDAAFLSPIDYGRSSSEYLIVPQVGVASVGESRLIRLYFHEGLHKIKTIAVDIGMTSELVLAKIIFAEKYDTDIQFLPMKPNLDEMLAKADAALLVGDQVLFQTSTIKTKLDLVDQWHDLTELVYVHGFWVGREHTFTGEEITLLRRSQGLGVQHLKDIAQGIADERNISREASLEYLRSLQFGFAEDAIEGLSEFFRYAFYYGALSDIPKIKFYSDAEQQNFSLN